jgi:hypothetical protein
VNFLKNIFSQMWGNELKPLPVGKLMVHECGSRNGLDALKKIKISYHGHT